MLADAVDCTVSRLSKLMQPCVGTGTAGLGGSVIITDIVQDMGLLPRLTARKSL